MNRAYSLGKPADRFGKPIPLQPHYQRGGIAMLTATETLPRWLARFYA